MKENRKWLVTAIIVLFVGASVVPSISSVITTVDTEPLDTHVEIEIVGIMGDNDWYTSPVTITFTMDPDGDVYIIMYNIDGGEWITYTGPIVICEDGIYLFCWYYVDSHGSESDVECIEIKIDQTPPTIWLTVEKIDSNTWLFIADVSDETSGVAKVEFYVNSEYVGEATEYPYEWIYNITPSTGFSVKGLIFNPKITEETVSFFAVIAIGSRWHSTPDCPSVQAIVFDNAGNLNTNPVSQSHSPIDNELYFYIFKQLTFSNDYSGRVGKLFINAIFADFPSVNINRW